MSTYSLSELIFKKIKDNVKRPALFFDRDGVLIKDCHYISNPNDVVLEKCSKNLVRFAFDQGWIVIIISNQSGISRKFFTWKEYKIITDKMINLFGEPNPFYGIYANSEGPKSINKTWRKPNPSMIIKASEVFNIDLEKSIIVGDRKSDLIAGLRSGIKKIIHTKTGHGNDEIEEVYNLKSKYANLKEFEFININNLCEFPTSFLSKIL